MGTGRRHPASPRDRVLERRELVVDAVHAPGWRARRRRGRGTSAPARRCTAGRGSAGPRVARACRPPALPAPARAPPPLPPSSPLSLPAHDLVGAEDSRSELQTLRAGEWRRRGGSSLRSAAVSDVRFYSCRPACQPADRPWRRQRSPRRSPRRGRWRRLRAKHKGGRSRVGRGDPLHETKSQTRAAARTAAPARRET